MLDGGNLTDPKMNPSRIVIREVLHAAEYAHLADFKQASVAKTGEAGAFSVAMRSLNEDRGMFHEARTDPSH